YPHYFVAPISFVFSPKLQMVRQYPACVSILQKNTSPNSASSNYVFNVKANQSGTLLELEEHFKPAYKAHI
ncbi:hypothetical protein, partial [Porphyromonas levii]|uniref:hypothetical protein n=1 Tax=Porphyromonas levii TaxID=28114 RepID=UPI001BAC171D